MAELNLAELLERLSKAEADIEALKAAAPPPSDVAVRLENLEGKNAALEDRVKVIEETSGRLKFVREGEPEPDPTKGRIGDWLVRQGGEIKEWLDGKYEVWTDFYAKRPLPRADQ